MLASAGLRLHDLGSTGCWFSCDPEGAVLCAFEETHSITVILSCFFNVSLQRDSGPCDNILELKCCLCIYQVLA